MNFQSPSDTLAQNEYRVQVTTVTKKPNVREVNRQENDKEVDHYRPTTELEEVTRFLRRMGEKLSAIVDANSPDPIERAIDLGEVKELWALAFKRFAYLREDRIQLLLAIRICIDSDELLLSPDSFRAKCLLDVVTSFAQSLTSSTPKEVTEYLQELMAAGFNLTAPITQPKGPIPPSATTPEHPHE